MKSLSLLCGIVLFSSICAAQPVAQLEAGYWHFPSIDHIFRTYNLSHPWSDSEVAPISMSSGFALGWNQKVYAPRGVHAIGLVHYRYQSNTLQRSSSPIRAGFHQVCTELLIRTHPRCFVKEVQQTGPLGTRWYIQLGAGYSWNLPFASKYGEKVYVANDERYRSISGQFHLSGGTGWHAFTIGPLAVTIESTVSWYPKFTLESFPTAVLGHNQPGLSETNRNSFLLQGHIRFTYLKKSKNWWDAPRGGDKS
jgi:hypothetical protein